MEKSAPLWVAGFLFYIQREFDIQEDREMFPKEFIDKPRDECGVFGIYTLNDEVALKLYLGLNALQHRGEESAGIAVSNGTEIFTSIGV